ncbi:hypothetical protein BBJ28_00001087 [Nothophytophthora sp. Chile5]|nr:hypothetical protein BBJ28_00001087 [Nothophytophthora sp. Chile5]
MQAPSEAQPRGGAVLSPRPTPRPTTTGADAVVVMAQEALAAAALSWQERAERLLAANTRLKDRVTQVEAAHRKYVHQVTTVTATNQTTEDEVVIQEKEEAAPSALSSRENLVALARHPLVAELKRHLRDLEVDLERLRQENELLRLELEQQKGNERRPAAKSSVSLDANTATSNSNNQEELQECVAAQLQQMKVLEARYQQMEAKTRAKTTLYQENAKHLEEMNAQLFDVQQQLAAQTEKLQTHRDQTALVDDLSQENHLLRSENAKLNETVDTLSSRPFDALSSELQKKNLWISQLEEEKRLLEVDRVKTQQACIVTRSANELLRHRIEGLTADGNDLAKRLSRAKAECEQQIAEKEVAQLQLRFYLGPADKTLMAVVGKALKEMKRQDQQGLSFLSEAVGDGATAAATRGGNGAVAGQHSPPSSLVE